MHNIRNCMLRLRVSTIEMLRESVGDSVHRSMSSLADEILEQELKRRRGALDRFIDAAKR